MNINNKSDKMNDLAAKVGQLSMKETITETKPALPAMSAADVLKKNTRTPSNPDKLAADIAALWVVLNILWLLDFGSKRTEKLKKYKDKFSNKWFFKEKKTKTKCWIFSKLSFQKSRN